MGEEEKPKAKCSNCKHRQAKHVCGCNQSHFYMRVIQLTDRCDFYLFNPANVHLTNGMAYALGDAVGKAVAEFEAAIRLGLPHDDEMQAHSFLSDQHRLLARASSESPEDFTASSHVAQAIEQMEKALLMDREGGYAYFSEQVNRPRLADLDTMYYLVGTDIYESRGEAVAIRYLKQKVGLTDYLPSCPLLRVLLKLGALYMLQEQAESARECLRNLLAAAPVDVADESGEEREVRDQARVRLATSFGPFRRFNLAHLGTL